jgi:hypothetical protein
MDNKKEIYKGYTIVSIINSLNITDEVKIFKGEQLINDGFAEIENAKKYIDVEIDRYKKAHDHLMATNWNYAIKEHIKTGLESPTPYKVIPYKNGIGIKKIEFIKPKKINSNLKRFLSATKFKQS